MHFELLKRPSAYVPLAMSIAALSIVLGYAAMFGTAQQVDEGTAAHVWQMLMAGQIPVIAFFVFKWFSSQPKQASLVDCPTSRNCARRDVPGLVVPLVTESR